MFVTVKRLLSFKLEYFVALRLCHVEYQILRVIDKHLASLYCVLNVCCCCVWEMLNVYDIRTDRAMGWCYAFNAKYRGEK